MGKILWKESEDWKNCDISKKKSGQVVAYTSVRFTEDVKKFVPSVVAVYLS